MKVTWVRVAVFLILVAGTVSAGVQGVRLFNVDALPAHSYEIMQNGFVYTTAADEVAEMELYSNTQFTIECDGKLLEGQKNEFETLPSSSPLNYKYTVTCQRVMVLIGSPHASVATAMTGVNIFPAGAIFFNVVMGLIVAGFSFWACFYWKK